MTADPLLALERRDFLKLAGAMTAFGSGTTAQGVLRGRVAIVIDANDPVPSAGPVKWAAGQLLQALSAKGSPCGIFPSLESGRGFCVLHPGGESRLRFGQRVLRALYTPRSARKHPNDSWEGRGITRNPDIRK